MIDSTTDKHRFAKMWGVFGLLAAVLIAGSDAYLILPTSCQSPLSIDYGRVTIETNADVGGLARYVCNDGFTMSGDAQIQCVQPDEGGIPRWTKEPSCQDIEAPLFDDHPDEVYRLPPGDRYVTVKVDPMTANDPNGPVEVQCNPVIEAPLNIAVGECVIKCTAKDIFDNTRSDEYIITVFDNSCGDPPELENGVRQFDTTIIGDVANYNCDEGFRLVGDNTARCGLENGDFATFNNPAITPTWQGSRTCQPLRCDVPDGPENGGVNVAGRRLGGSASFFCNDGFRPSRDSLDIECISGPDGAALVWSDGPPTCERLRCEAPPKLRNGAVNVDGRQLGARATYSCNEGFTPDRKKLAVECIVSPDGTGLSWSAPPPKCNINDVLNTDPKPDRQRCPRGYTLVGKRCYRFVPDLAPWEQQAKECRRLNGELAVPNSASQMGALNSFLAKNSKGGSSRVWLGAHSLVQPNTFMDMGTKSLSYTNWASNSPRDTSAALGPDCVSAAASSGEWANECCYERYAAVCEVDPIGDTNTIGQSPAAPQVECRKDYVSFEGRCLRYVKKPASFDKQFKTCQELGGGELATATPDRVVDQFNEEHGENKVAWFFLHDQIDDGVYQTAKLAVLRQLKWASDEPSGAGDCAAIGRRGWVERCCYNELPAICETRARPIRVSLIKPGPAIGRPKPVIVTNYRK